MNFDAGNDGKGVWLGENGRGILQCGVQFFPII